LAKRDGKTRSQMEKEDNEILEEEYLRINHSLLHKKCRMKTRAKKLKNLRGTIK
jgi:hypothetical protein